MRPGAGQRLGSTAARMPNHSAEDEKVQAISTRKSCWPRNT